MNLKDILHSKWSKPYSNFIHYMIPFVCHSGRDKKYKNLLKSRPGDNEGKIDEWNRIERPEKKTTYGQGHKCFLLKVF